MLRSHDAAVATFHDNSNFCYVVKKSCKLLVALTIALGWREVALKAAI